jgi:hypothetical protein
MMNEYEGVGAAFSDGTLLEPGGGLKHVVEDASSKNEQVLTTTR